VLASELYRIINSFNIGACVKTTIDLILGEDLPLILYRDLKSFYEYLVKLGTIQEKRLIINIIALRKAYKRKKIT
jgi:hypothetical protein